MKSTVKLVVVESPAKAKAIGTYLGSEYMVLASFGHVRDLVNKQGSVRPDDDFSLVWEVPEKAKQHLKDIVSWSKKADTVIFATDLDREGEGIAWHLLMHLQEQKAISPKTEIHRISFNAVTKSAILEAMKKPRSIDDALVGAYLARLSLDYLVGFTLSPILWRKLPGSRSAGRVQSVALRVVVDREKEIFAFKIQEYWTIHGDFFSHDPAKKDHHFSGQLSHFHGKKLGKLDIPTEEEAQRMVQEVQKHSYAVDTIEKKRIQRQSSPPFITSSLQQEASRKLGFSPSRTMQIAQKLYEGLAVDGETVGLITYMRTDSPHIIPEFLKEVASYVATRWGKEYVCEHNRVYKKSRHAQEAHEAIRPTSIHRSPEQMRKYLTEEQAQLYELIWCRTVASKMAPAVYDSTVVCLTDPQKQHIFRVTGSILVFHGFLILYVETREDDDEEDNHSITLPVLQEKEEVQLDHITPQQHFTQPPPRYTEASLVKKLEELGVGRPSTYARILKILLERLYVRKEKNRLIPEELGIVVTGFLKKFFSRYVDYHFTAGLEDELDNVSLGEKTWKEVLRDFWVPFEETVQAASKLSIIDVLSSIEDDVIWGGAQKCPKCEKNMLVLRVGKRGPFLACGGYPECTYVASLSAVEKAFVPEKVLGPHSESGEDVILRNGSYGWWVQCGDKKAFMPPLFHQDTLTLADAQWLLSLPRQIGYFPDTQLPVLLGIGRFGPYAKYDGAFFSLKKNAEELQHISLEEVVPIILQGIEKKKNKPAKDAKKTFGKKTTTAAKKAPSAAKKSAPSKKTSPSKKPSPKKKS